MSQRTAFGVRVPPVRLLSGLMLCLPFAPASAIAQSAAGPGAAPHTYVHEAWTVRDGLHVNSINGLLQSRDGYIWAVTFDGLVRFDGVRFTVFNSANSDGLPSSRIIEMIETREGSLWLRTEQFHLVRFRGGEFTHFGAQRGLTRGAYTIYEDGSGVLWIGTDQGLGMIRGERFVPVAEQIQHRVNSIIRRRDGSVWVGTIGNGLYRIDGAQTTKIPAADLAAAHIRTLYEDPSGTLWVGAETGIWVERDGWTRIAAVGGALSTVLKFINAPLTGYLIAYAESGVFRIDGNVAIPIDARGRVLLSALLWTDRDGAVWHATGPEIFRDGDRVYSLAAEPSNPLPPTTITSGIFDHEGSLWLGTHASGLNRLKPALFTVYGLPEGLAYRNAYTVYQDRSGVVWVGTHGNGVSRIDSEGRIISYTTTDGLPANINTILQDRSDRLLIGSSTGVFSCALPRMTCTREHVTDGSGTDAFAIFQDREGHVWLGTSAGLFRSSGRAWLRMPESAGAPTTPVRAFAQTLDGALWMGTNGGGLVRYDGGTFTPLTTAHGLGSDLIRSLYQDADGWLWVGTEGRGLARFDPRAWSGGTAAGDRRIVHYRAADGLFDEVIHQILEDDFGRLWMSTNRGIFWVPRAGLNAFADGRTSTIHSTGYTERDGLRNREANGGVQPAGIKARDGRLWFATQDGVAVVDPTRLRSNRVAPPVVIERVIVNGTTLQAGGASLQLDVEQRNLQIDYTALSFLEPGNVRFRYRLEPYDADWIDAGDRRRAFYTRVPPGRYTFRVIASNNDGVWNEQGATLELSLAPHLWETTAFRISVLLVLVLVGIVTVRARELRLRRRSHELEQVVADRTSALREREQQLGAQNEQLEIQAVRLHELDQAKSRLFTNLSHEFRTPLTLIIGPLRTLLEGRHGTLPPSAREQSELMLRNSQRLLRLINQILDLAKLQAREVRLDRRTYDLVSVVRAATLAFTPLAERRGITLRFHTDLQQLALDFDVEQLEKVLLNLLSNGLKFTEAAGVVEVSMNVAAEAAEIVVRDTGVGIAPEELAHVFDRFYQADTSATRRYEGTGIGLALAKELVELHGGEIRADSVPGEGSTFTVRLPLGDAAGPMQVTPEPETVRSALPMNELSAPASEPLEEAANDRTTILVIDDNAGVRAYVRSVLATSYRVIEAGNGRTGLECAVAALPDLIVADVMMPELDGLALGRALKADPMTDAIPVVLLTARAAAEDQIEGLATGADAYLVKPFDPAVLEAQVANLLAQRHRLRERFRAGAAPPRVPVPVTPSPLDQRLRPLVEAHLHDPDFGPDALAAAASLSYHQLYRALRDELETTPSRFIRTVRVECAAELLQRRAGSVTEIAYSVGFESLSYFSRAFRERFGTSPTAHLAAL